MQSRRIVRNPNSRLPPLGKRGLWEDDMKKFFASALLALLLAACGGSRVNPGQTPTPSQVPMQQAQAPLPTPTPAGLAAQNTLTPPAPTATAPQAAAATTTPNSTSTPAAAATSTTAAPAATLTPSAPSYPLAGTRHNSPQGEKYSAIWEANGWLHQDRLPTEGQRIGHVLSITLTEGRYTFAGVSCRLHLDTSRNGKGADNARTVGYGNGLPFEVRTTDHGQAWAFIVCDPTDVTGFSVQWQGALR